MASFSRIIFKNIRKSYTLHSRSYVNPFTRTFDILSKEIKSGLKRSNEQYIEHTDVVVIGGGFIGSSVAYWLKSRAGEGLSVVVLEKDPAYKNSENIHSHGVLNQHFTLPENILLSQYSAEFLRNIKEHLDEGIDIQFCPHGYLILASEDYAYKLEQNVTLQRENGVNNKLLSIEDIQNKYPWINTSGIKLGCISTETEGIFNAKALLHGFINKSKLLGATYIQGEVTSFKMELQREALMEGVPSGSYKKTNCLSYYSNDDGKEHNLKFAVCVVTAGNESNHIAKLAKIGLGEGLLRYNLPVEKREYNVYSIEGTDGKIPIGLNIPYVMDTSGLWLRRNGLNNNILCGQIPALQEEKNVSLNGDIFQTSLASRYPQFQNAQVKVLSTEMIDCNTYDDTGILGPHVYHNNLYFATGFGKQGVLHSPGIGRAVAELIIDGQFTTIDLMRFGFDRLLTDQPLIEFNMY